LIFYKNIKIGAPIFVDPKLKDHNLTYLNIIQCYYYIILL